MNMDWTEHVNQTLNVTLYENYGAIKDPKTDKPLYEIVFKTGKLVNASEYFWCMVYGAYSMFVRNNVNAAYEWVMPYENGAGQSIGNEDPGNRYLCGMSMGGWGANSRAMILIDPKSGV